MQLFSGSESTGSAVTPLVPGSVDCSHKDSAGPSVDTLDVRLADQEALGDLPFDKPC